MWKEKLLFLGWVMKLSQFRNHFIQGLPGFENK